MEYPTYKQENYPQELGSGQGYTIAKYGCALCCVTSVVNWYGHAIAPDQLNLECVTHDGFSSNGTVNTDGTENKTLLRWGIIAAIYPDVRLEQNIAYPKNPADMQMIDAYLIHNMPVIVGVSFTHTPNAEVPSHYVVIYHKNADGSYQMFDPWFGDHAVFDTRYAVNGMTPAECILQMVAYAGTPPAAKPATAPIEAHTQVAQTPAESALKQAQDNWNLYLQEVDLVKLKDDRIQELQGQLQVATDANTKLTKEIGYTKAINSTLAKQVSDLEAEDSAAVDEGIRAQEQLKKQQEIVQGVAGALKAKPTLTNILKELDNMFTKINWARRVTPAHSIPVPPVPPQAPKPVTAKPTVLQLLGIS